MQMLLESFFETNLFNVVINNDEKLAIMAVNNPENTR
jgi:hypothetical protein